MSLLSDNWWCLVDGSFFTRVVDTYKSIVVFMLTGGKRHLVPPTYDDYFLATLRLLEKLHKVTSARPRQAFCPDASVSVTLRGLRLRLVCG